MPYNSNLYSTKINALEYNKFVEIYNDSRFPPITSVVQSYDDNTTQTNVYNKNAMLTYLVNASDITLSAGNLNIGNVHISDAVDNAIEATVRSLGVNDGALQVISARTTAVSGNVGEANSSSWSITQVTVTTAGYTAFPSALANIVSVSNTTNDTLLMSKNGTGIGMPLLNNSTIDVSVESNANEIYLKATTSTVAVSAYGLITKY